MSEHDEHNPATVKKDLLHLDEMKITYLPVDAVKPNDYNPNRQGPHEFELLCRSMKTDGFTQPVVALQPVDGQVPTPASPAIIVDGFHRWKAAQHIGLTEIPVVLVSMTEAQRRISTLRHNRARGHEDPTRVASLLKELANEGNLDWASDELLLDPVEISHLTRNVDVTTEDILREQAKAETAERVEADDLTEEEAAQLESDLLRQKREALSRSENAGQDAQADEESSGIYQLRFIYADEGEVATLTAALGDRDERQDRLLEMCRLAEAGTI